MSEDEELTLADIVWQAAWYVLQSSRLTNPAMHCSEIRQEFVRLMEAPNGTLSAVSTAASDPESDPAIPYPGTD